MPIPTMAVRAEPSWVLVACGSSPLTLSPAGLWPTATGSRIGDEVELPGVGSRPSADAEDVGRPGVGDGSVVWVPIDAGGGTGLPWPGEVPPDPWVGRVGGGDVGVGEVEDGDVGGGVVGGVRGGRFGAIPGGGAEPSVWLSENDQPSKPPGMASRLSAPTWL